MFFLFAISSCDVDDDFTSGNFYPVDYVPPEEEVGDTTDTPVYNPQDCWDENVFARHNTTFNNYFTRYGDGWTGGDATYSIPIDDNTNLWLFGDTFLGTVRADRSRSGSPLINNTIVLQEGETFTTFHGGTAAAPKAFLAPPEEDWWYWPGHGQVHNGQVQLIMFALGRTSQGGAFGFEYTAIDLATLSLPDLEIISVERKMLFDGANYGACLLQYDGFTYIYGAYKTGLNKFMHVARVPGTDLSQEWEYFAGANSWTTNVSDSKAVFSNVSEQFSVIHRPNGFYLMTQNYFLGKELYLYSGPTPIGPFENRQTLFCTPETNDRIFTYNAFVHEQFSTENNLFISYNNNSHFFVDLFSNADNYRPHFVNVEGWLE
ncbi:MAG: DUF5005 domain-containing protein [Saprospiraceae bacterium]|nr:MAG: DUF5005 domain-containing protein [Saprospiraceae bacterium]